MALEEVARRLLSGIGVYARLNGLGLGAKNDKGAEVSLTELSF